MKRVPRGTSVLVLVLLAIGRNLDADPRFWTHDRVITSGGAAKTHPDVTFVDLQGAAPAGALLVAWQENSTRGDPDVKVQVSFDGGCTWCGPVTWAGTAKPETYPRVAAGVLPGAARLSIQVAYVSESLVWVASDASLAIGTPADMCNAFTSIGTPARRQLSAGVVPSGSGTRIVAVGNPGTGGYLHFHAVWGGEASGPVVLYDHDTAGDGSGWGPGMLNLSLKVQAQGYDADVAADTLSGSASASAATVFFVKNNSAVIVMGRSVDSGSSWSTATTISGSTSVQARPAADSGAGATAAWNGCAWQARDDPRDVTLDAAFWTAPATRNPDFDPSASDQPVSQPPSTPGTAPSLSIGPEGQGSAVLPLFVFWTADATPPEIVARGGVLDAGNPGKPRDLDRYPFAGPRTAPPDVTASVVEPHSNCRWDDGWPAMGGSTCDVVPRPPGSGARDVASADGPAAVGLPARFFTVFSDFRAGGSQIVLKATDGTVEAPVLSGLTPGCAGLLEAQADVSFPLVGECPARVEWIDRYIVYYGSETSEGASPTGPFVNRAVFPRVGLVDPDTVTLAGLKPAEVYDFTLIAEDEARNINPPAFDPRAATSTAAASQRKDRVTMPTCRPALTLACAASAVACGSSAHSLPAHPGDTVTLTLTFSNGGDWDASGVSAMLVATGGTVVSPAGGVLSIPSIPRLGSVPVTVEVRLDPTCPASGPTLAAVGLESDSGKVTYGSPACAGALVAVDCGTTCAGCVAGGLGAIRPLRAVKSGTGSPPPDVRFEWPADPALPLEYHVNHVNAKASIPTAHAPPRGSGQTGCVARPGPGCTHASGVLDANPLLCYQTLSACGSGGDEEGPE